MKDPLTSQIAVVIDIKNAPFLPLVKESLVYHQKSRHFITQLTL
jgi:hypothetical protein